MDRKDFEGDLVSSVQGALAFLGQHIPLKYKIKALKREEIPMIPEAATREALLNAVIHRDYFERSGSIMLELYRNRLQIVNPGGLVSGLQLKDLGRYSFPRNPLIADLFFRLGYVEKAGTGIERIRNSIQKSGLPHPVFEADFFFSLTFPVPIERDGFSKHHDRDQVGTKSTCLNFAKLPDL